METLRNAERAAGFAMAAADDPAEDRKALPERDTNPWRPGEAVLKSDAPKARSGWRSSWMRSLASFFGLGATA